MSLSNILNKLEDQVTVVMVYADFAYISLSHDVWLGVVSDFRDRYLMKIQILKTVGKQFRAPVSLRFTTQEQSGTKQNEGDYHRGRRESRQGQ